MADNNNIELGKFSFDVDEVVKSAAELKKTIDDLKKNQKELTKEGQESSAEFVQNAASLKVLNGEYNKHIKVITESMTATADQINREELLNVALNAEITTIKEARENNKLLNKLRNETNTTTTEGQEQIRKLNNQLDANNEFVKENADQYLKQKINIGNYRDALQGVSPQLATIIGQLESMYAGLMAQRSALQASTVGLTGTSKALKLFRIALISTGIGAIVVALGALVSYLTTTQAGIDAVTSVTRPLSAMFQTVLGIIQNLGKSLFDAFKNPKQSITDLYNFVKDKIMIQFEAFYNILVGIATLDFDQAKQGFKTLGDEATGAFNKVKGAVVGFGDAMVEAAAKGAEIDRLQKSIEQREIDIIALRAETTSELLKQETIIKNQLATDEERRAAILESERLTKNLATAENLIVQEQIKQLEIKQSLNDTSREDLKQLETLRASLITNNDKIAENQKKNIRAIKQLEDNNRKLAEKTTDNAIKKQKELLDLFITEQGVKAKTLQEEIFLQEVLSEKRKAILKEELKANKISQEKYRDEVLKIDNDIIKMRADLAVENASRELDIYKRTIDEKLKAEKFLSDEVAKQRQADNANLLQEQLNFAALQLEQGVINQNDFDEAVRTAKEEARIANEEIDKQREAIKKEEAKQLREIEFQEELERLEEERATKLEIEQAQATEARQLEIDKLNADREAGLISEELFRQREAQIDRKYKKLALEREQILAQQKLDAISGTIGAVASVVDKNSAAGKALGIAQALMNTYQGISAGVKLGYPQAIPAVAAAASTGFKAAKDIASQELPSLAGGNTGGGSSTPGLGADMSSILGKNVNLNQIAASGNSAVQSQIENQANMNGLSDNVAKAVEAGAQAGTMKGSEQGMTNLSDNKNIMQKSEF